MSFISKNKRIIIIALCVLAALTIAFFCGGTQQSTLPTANAPASSQAVESPAPISETDTFSAEQPEPTSAPDTPTPSPAPASAPAFEQPQSDQTATQSPAPIEASPDSSTNRLTCFLSVRCDTAVGKSSSKEAVIPSNGIIFPEHEVEFYDGESVFDVLLREMRNNKIHMEFVNTPIYNSAYIEGINNLYEFDCGELSGWMYRVNSVFPAYGCSRYILKNGDKVEWVYTCDLGKDVGGEYSAGNGVGSM